MTSRETHAAIATSDMSNDIHIFAQQESGNVAMPRESNEKEHQAQTADDETPHAHTAHVDSAPNGGLQAWITVVGCALINGHSWGINSSYGVFLAYYLSHNTFPGATYLEFAFVGGLSISMALLVAPLATNTTRLYSTRTTLLIGVFLEAGALIGASFATKIWHLFLSQGVCFGWGMGFLFVGSVGLIPQWFTTRRSFANAIGAGGSGIGGLVYSLATNAIIQRISLPWAFRILGMLAFGVNMTCALVLKDRNKQIGTSQLAFDVHLFRRPQFLLIEFWGFFSMLGYIVLLFSLPNYAESIGLTPRQASIVGAILNLGQGIGRPPVGYFSDRVGRINMAMFMTFLSGLFCLAIWAPANSYGVLLFYALVGGAVAGTFWAVSLESLEINLAASSEQGFANHIQEQELIEGKKTIAPVSAEVVGLKELPTALSLTWLFLVLPCTFSEPMALEIVQKSRAGYLGAQLFAGFMYIAAALCLLFLRVWKIRDNECKAIKEKDAALGHKDAAHDVSASGGPQMPLLKALVAWKKV